MGGSDWTFKVIFTGRVVQHSPIREVMEPPFLAGLAIWLKRTIAEPADYSPSLSWRMV